jgi:hypothetical protein
MIAEHYGVSCVVAPTEETIKEGNMPIILWLLGVPLSLIIVLALLGVF